MAKEETRSDRSTNPAGSEFFDALQEMRRDWMARATAEVELSLKLSKKLTEAYSVTERWRSIKVTEFEQRQITAVRKELDQEYENQIDLKKQASKERPRQNYPATYGLDPPSLPTFRCNTQRSISL